jgi:hypothetical protein
MVNQVEQKLKNIIDKLYEQLFLGWRAFLIAKYINQARKAKRIRCAHAFFGGVYVSCLESAFLALARIIIEDNRGKPVNIWYLLNYLRDDPVAANTLPTVSGYVPQHGCVPVFW